MNQVEFAIAYDRLQRSPKQKEVLLRFLSGEADAEIASALEIEAGTVRKQLSGVCKVFGLKDDERRSRRGDLIAIFSRFKPELLGRLGKDGVIPAAWPVAEAGLPRKGSSSLYIERPPVESICDQEILRPHALIRIKGPGQVGKTELLKRILSHAEAQGFLSVHLNLLLADASILTNLDTFLRWVCSYVGRKLQMPNQVEEFWDSSLSSNDNCTAYFDECLLANLNSPLVLGFDNVDLLFAYPAISLDFFGLLRAWHEDGKLGNDWGKLRLIVSHSTEVYVPLQIHRSPFNVGLPIELPEFTVDQVRELAQQYEVAWSSEDLKQITDLVGGHPSLIHLILRQAKAHPEFSAVDLLSNSSIVSGLFASHLRDQWMKLQQQPELIETLQKILSSSSTAFSNPVQIHQLERIGVIRVQDGELQPRCKLYKIYFERFLHTV